jgi:hypothetical protein
MKEFIGFPLVIFLVLSATAGSVFFVIATISKKDRKRWLVGAGVMAITFVSCAAIVRFTFTRRQSVDEKLAQVKVGIKSDHVLHHLSGCHLKVTASPAEIESITVIKPGLIFDSSAVIYFERGTVTSVYDSSL